MKRDYFERRDVIFVLNASMMSVAALGSHAKININSALDITHSDRSDLVRAVFPYLETGKGKKENENYDVYFDELDAIIEAKERMKRDGDEPSSVGEGEGK